VFSSLGAGAGVGCAGLARPPFAHSAFLFLGNSEFSMATGGIKSHRRARPPGKWRSSPNPCKVCEHPDRHRIDFLIISTPGVVGSGRRKIGEKFGLSQHSVYNHAKNHIGDEYRAAILAGPFGSEEELRDLAAQEGTSVLENYRVTYNGHRQRWLRALELGQDQLMSLHGKMMNELLWRMGQLTREILPHGPTPAVQNIYYNSPDFYEFQRRAIKVLRAHPEALEDWVAEFRSSLPGLIDEAPVQIEDGSGCAD
jgi:hypothetical protein